MPKLTDFAKAAGIRALRSAAQAAVLVIGSDAAVNAFEIDWQLVAGMSLGMAAMSVLTSLATGLPEA